VQFGAVKNGLTVQLFHSNQPSAQADRQEPELSQMRASWHQPSNCRLFPFCP
jgi:hypothetical protein